MWGADLRRFGLGLARFGISLQAPWEKALSLNEEKHAVMDVKQKIVQIVEALPEELLEDLLNFLEQIEKEPQDKIRLSLNLGKILVEDQEVLERLAQ
jgi:hypothetical protein